MNVIAFGLSAVVMALLGMVACMEAAALRGPSDQPVTSESSAPAFILLGGCALVANAIVWLTPLLS